jgi:pyridoxamine 5'-phosphate oxidase
MNIADIRKDYKLKALLETDVADNPFAQFNTWWQEATASEIDEVNAMTLATVTKDGLPDARIVLLKGFDEKGFVFYTNYESAKGKELAINPNACLVFFWKELERQVRICGTVEKLSAEMSDAYFNSRPLGSRIGALVSNQSSVIENRSILEQKTEQLTKLAETEPITRPNHWGGYLVIPGSIEFWQGRANRLHDRLKYTKQEQNTWRIERLAP